MAKKGLDVGKIGTTAKEYSQVKTKIIKIDNFSFTCHIKIIILKIQ